MITFTATREQSDNLEGLAYWVSDRAWSRERGKLDKYEDRRTGDTIRAIFDALDQLKKWLDMAAATYPGAVFQVRRLDGKTIIYTTR